MKARLTTDGLTLFKLTWREKATPAGRLVYRLAASGRRTSDKDSGSWPTPQAMDTMTPRDPATFDKWNNERDGRKNRKFVSNLPQAVLQHMGSWPTPIVGDTTGGPRPPDDTRGPAPGLQAAAHLTSWPTTSTRDYKGGYRGGAYERRQDQHGHARCSGATGFWDNCDWLSCRDGKYRPVESGTFPLAHGSTARVGRLRAYGNAIVPQAAQALIEAYLET